MRGRIIKGVSGDYSVHCGREAGIYLCRARGLLRRDGRRPLVGDLAELEILDEEKRLGSIRELLPRRNELVRPAVANVDQALVVFSMARPAPSFNLLDRFLVGMGQQGIPCIVCFNKRDLDQGQEGERCREIYESCGYPSLAVSALEGVGLERLRELLQGRTTVTAGPSGVGKSSLVNRLQDGVVMATGEISAKIHRGKHTTRHTELLPMGEDAYILDTPGFSSLGLFDLEKEELGGYYPEFGPHEKYCRFGGCSHTKEPDCGVKEAVEKGLISGLRYKNYCLLYQELKDEARW